MQACPLLHVDPPAAHSPLSLPSPLIVGVVTTVTMILAAAIAAAAVESVVRTLGLLVDSFQVSSH